MFVRFRQARRRLQVSLVETRRADGKVRHEHVAGLGAIEMPPSVADRVEFWRRLHERLGQLSNRLDTAAQAKVLGEVHGRVPMPTIDEMRALQLANTEAEARFWEALQEMNAEAAEGKKQLAADVARGAAEAEAASETARDRVQAAKDRVERLKRGEAVAGGLGKQPTLRDLGWGAKEIKRARMVAELSALGGFDELLAEIEKRKRLAERAAIRVVLRRRRGVSVGDSEKDQQ